MKKFLCLVLFFACTLPLLTPARATNPKREFRGAWIQCVNGQWTGMGRDRMQQTLTSQLDELQRCGINAIFFQVRAEGDALYQSTLEPWSRFLTGQQGLAPTPYWDPLDWMVRQCHSRGMELHAWINPYRAKTKGTASPAASHQAALHPERVFAYGDLLIFDPGLPENRAYVCRVATDIVQRYDVDGLHMDDYFYPYPEAGVPIPDDRTFQTYNNGFTDRGDWRRNNVNLLIKELNEALYAVKPWVKFSISPFGIYHNAKESSTIPGSNTRGLQNYDDLYADVLLWMNKGWIDFCIPQIYWQIGHPTADYATLIRWWSSQAVNRPVFVGQDVERTVKYADVDNPRTHQMAAKYNLQRSLKGIGGSCQWYAAAVCRDEGKYGTLLKQYWHSTPALQPLMPWIDAKAPGKPRKLKPIVTEDGKVLFWTAPKAKAEADKAHGYVVYRYAKGERVDLSDPAHIVAITSNTFYVLPDRADGARCTYVVTALDRLQNESKGVRKTVKP